MSKHTPGEWKTDGTEVFVETGNPYNDGIIADTGWCRDYSEGLANARLIAAAPKLLEALKMAMPCVQELLQEFCEPEYQVILKQVEEAIAEAEGTDSPGGVK